MQHLVRKPKNITLEKWLDKNIENLPPYQNQDNQLSTYYNVDDKELMYTSSINNDCIPYQYIHNSKVYLKNVFIEKNTVRYSMDMVFKELVDFCYDNDIVYNDIPLIGPHNKNTLKQFVYHFSN